MLKLIKKYILSILIFILTGCLGMQPSGREMINSDPIRHSEYIKSSFDLSLNEQIWSRAHYYVFVYMAYPPSKTYNPYMIHAERTDPFRDIIVVREIAGNTIDLSISYTADIKPVSLPSNNDKSPELEDAHIMKNLIEDMLEYIKTGKHLFNLKKNPAK